MHQISRAGDLRIARQLVADVARGAGLIAERCEQLVLAVSEVATNAIRHGGGPATVLGYADDQAVTVDIHDHSDTPIPPPPRAPPAAADVHGRGLWLAAQLCDRVEIKRVTGGNLVRLIMSL